MDPLDPLSSLVSWVQPPFPSPLHLKVRGPALGQGFLPPTATHLESMGGALLTPKLTAHRCQFPLGRRNGLWFLKGSTI